jgi:AraC-like DNA-binding protein
LKAKGEAYAPSTVGGNAVVLVVDWDTRQLGAGYGTFESNRLTANDIARIDQHSRMLASGEGDAPIRASIEILNILRAVGLPIEKVNEADLVDRQNATTHEADQRLLTAINAKLSNLASFPSIDDVSDELGWSGRHTNRRLSSLGQTYKVPWPQWRTMLHATRMSNVLRLLSVPGATTELVARKTGFRSPSALCHALTKVNLPSPSVLSKACQAGALGAWTSIADRPPLVRAA